MACNDQINVGLGSSCSVEITYDMVLEDPNNPAMCWPVGPTAYEVEVYGPNGQVLPSSPFVTEAELNILLPVKVRHLASGNVCWSNLWVQDLRPPQLLCPPDTVLPCTANPDTALTGWPQVIECSDFDISFFDITTLEGCQNPSGILTRTWTAVDAYGNASSCSQQIAFALPQTDSIVFPPDRNDLEAPALLCPNPDLSPDSTGVPTIGGEPIEPGNPFCHVAVSYSDQVFSPCAGETLVLRTWTLIEWCGGTVTTHVQRILVRDETPPAVDCPADLSAGTDGSGLCTASVFLPPLTAEDECSDSLSVKIITPAGVLFGNGGWVEGLPLGPHLIRYEVSDACGNTSICEQTLTILDDDVPVMVCDYLTTVGLNNLGYAVVPASVFDDGSYDNCCLQRLEVRRLDGLCATDTAFAETVTFCCEDLGRDVAVELRGVDCAGNANVCTVVVHVSDLQAPLLSCPPDLTLECSADLEDLTLTGNPQATDACPGLTLAYEDFPNLNACGVGTVVRVWEATDASGNAVSCNQTFTLVDTTPLQVFFPPDTMLVGCTDPSSLHPDSLPQPWSRPLVAGEDCELAAIHFEDEIFQAAAPACLKIVRTWTVIDWCSYSPNSGSGDGFFQGTQVLTLMDNEPPQLTCPGDLSFEILADDCSTELVLPPPTFSDCSAQLSIEVESDFGTGFGPFSGVLPGNYQATYRVFDGCGNLASCSISIEVFDAKKPAPYCRNGLVSTLMDTDPPQVTIQARDFDLGSTDNCSTELLFSFSPDPTDSLRTLGCNDLQGAPQQQVPLQIWVSDESGNQDFCETFLLLQDPQNLCGFQPSIAGKIATELGQGVEMVKVSVNDGVNAPVMTGPDGSFQFGSLMFGADYTVSPEKPENARNGVTTYDLLLIRKHILGLEFLDSPYKIIAADVNRSGNVSTYDLVELQKIVLFIDTTFSNNTSWRFVRADYVFPDPTNPFLEPFPEVLNVNNLVGDLEGADFVAVKVGDVNHSATPALGVGVEERGRYVFRAEERCLEAGETAFLSLLPDEQQTLRAFQFSMNFDPQELEWQGWEAGALQGFGDENLGKRLLNQGVLTASWHEIENQNLHPDAALFRLRFRARRATCLSESLALRSAPTACLVYTAEGAELRGTLQWESPGSILPSTTTGAEASFAGKAFPNPFKEATIVSFRLPESQPVQIRCWDSSGSLRWEEHRTLAAGTHRFPITQTQCPQPGAYLLQVQTPTRSFVVRLLKL